MSEHVFVCAYRFSQLRAVLIRAMFWMGLAALVLFPLMSFLFYRSVRSGVRPDTPPGMLHQLMLLCAAMGLVGASLGAAMLIAHRVIQRKVFDREIVCTGDALIERTPGREVRIPWSEMTKVRRVNLGRVKHVTVYAPGRRIRVDHTLVEPEDPQPRPALGLKGEVLKYPDGRKVPLDLEHSAVVRCIEEKVEGMQSSS